MILTDSSSARIGASVVQAIVSPSATFHQFMCYSETTISAAITGAAGLIKNGIGGLTLSGVCDYTGPTQINAGQIEISSASTLNGVISGAGSITKTGTSALVLGGSNTYSGGTLSAPSGTGTITFAQNNAFGTGLFTSAGPSKIICIATSTLTNNFQVNAGNSLQFRVNTQTAILTISGNVAGSGSINKTSIGRLHFNGDLTYTGSTEITGGFLRVFKTAGASLATATFNNATGVTSLSVSFNVAPPSGVTTDFRFFQGSTVQSFPSITLSGVPAGTTATYTSETSTLSVTVP